MISIPKIYNSSTLRALSQNTCFYPVGLFLLCLLTFANTFNNAFLIDDFTFLDGRHRYFFTSPLDLFTKSPSLHYSPLYFAMNIFLFDHFAPALWFLHLFNIFLFFLTALCFNRLLFLLTQNKNAAHISTLLFCVHPVNAEIVNRVSLNFILIHGLALILSFLLFWSSPEPRKWKWPSLVLSLLFYAVGLLSFEGALLFPVYLTAAVWFLRRDKFLKILPGVALFILLSLLFIFVWLIVVEPHRHWSGKINPVPLSWDEYFASLSFLILWYIGNLIYPHNFVWIKNIPPISQMTGLWNIAFLLLIGLSVGLFIFWRNKKPRQWSWLWFWAGFLSFPLTIFSHTEMGLVIEPHWFYFSSLGFFGLVGLLLAEWKVQKPGVKILAVAAVAALLFFITQKYNKIMHTEKSYAEYWQRVSPNNPVALMTLGKIYSEEGTEGQALESYQTILATSRYFPHVVHDHIAMIYAERQQFAEAHAHLSEALRLFPRYAKGYNTLGTLLFQEGKYPQAEAMFLRALELEPHLTFALLNLADLYFLIHQEEKARPYLEKVLKENPPHAERTGILLKLAIIHLKKKDVPKSLELIEMILAENGGPETYLFLADVFSSQGYGNMARLLLEEALKNFPDDPQLRGLEKEDLLR